MSSNTTPIFMGSYRNSLMQLTNEFGTRPRILWAPSPVGTAVVPGKLSSGAANGSRLHAVNASNTDTAAYALTLAIGTVLTVNANMGSPTITGNNTVNRTAGSFLSDGWRPGQLAYIQGASTLGNDVVAAVSSVTSTTLVFAASTFGANDNPFTGSVILLNSMTTVNVPASAGNSTSVPSVDLLGAGQLPVVFSGSDKFLVLGPNDVLVASSGSAITSGKQIAISVAGGDY